MPSPRSRKPMAFCKIDALADQMPAGTEVQVTLFTPHVQVPDLVIVGSHCTGLDLVDRAAGARAASLVRSIAGGQPRWSRRRASAANAIWRRSICSTKRPRPTTRLSGADGLELVPGWRRMQGIVFRKGDMRFEGLQRAGGGRGRARRSRLH